MEAWNRNNITDNLRSLHKILKVKENMANHKKFSVGGMRNEWVIGEGE